MRRKSERNKAKASPEKKPEKPTRKSTRRRAKKSPSTSPDRENSNDGDVLPSENESTTSTTLKKVHTRLQNKDTIETVVEEAETKVSSTETLLTPKKQEDMEDGVCVWKVARADASPGEIQKLKLCRQRNLSETSDVSLGKKRTSKWQEIGEGVAEEADSADEPPTSLNDGTNVGNQVSVDETSSSIPGRDSGEEVSDSKEIPPETTSADLSDVKPNIDQLQHDDETIETTNCIVTSVEKEKEEEEVIQQDVKQEGPAEPIVTDESTTVDNEPESIPATSEESEGIIVKLDEKETATIEAVDTKEPSTEVEKKGKIISEEMTVEPVEEEKEKETEKPPTSSAEEENPKKLSSSSEKSDGESNDVEKKTSSRPIHLTRRKPRNKYSDSSNSDTADSDDEPTPRRQEAKQQEEEVSERVRDKSPVVESPKSKSPVPENSNDKENNRDESDIETGNGEEKSDSTEEQVDRVTELPERTPIVLQKPVKVNLKRSFTRVSVDNSKKEETDALNDPSQDKENHVSEEPKTIPKRRRWGTVLGADTTPVLSISTDSLQALVPGARPLSMSEVRLTKDDDEDRERRREREKRHAANGDKVKEDSENTKNENSKDNQTSRRKISIVKDNSLPSPPTVQPTNVLYIKNLVRPFTLTQIKELLSRTGSIVENGFWMDRIKSKAYVEYSNEDQAFETRQALHGISWPPSNPKKLVVEYSTKEAMKEAKELFKNQLPSRKVEATSTTDGWPNDWSKDEKPNSMTKVTVVREWDLGKEDGQHLGKEKEREKRDLEKKRRQRSRSPTAEAHLPAPARKFKKKEDESPPAKLLDDLFRKTKATPCIYWLPLTNEQIVVKEEMRRQHMAEYARGQEEMRRAERNRDNRRRRSPRK